MTSPIIRHIMAGIILLALTIALALGAAMAGSPATAANAAMFAPAVQAADHLRPVWDGSHPKRWTGLDAMCPAGSARLHRWARTGKNSPWFRVECLPDGPGLWAWNAIITRNGR